MKKRNLNKNQELISIIKIQKKNNKIVGLCHGVFDLIHLGHIDHFKECKKNCDFLIVSITSDKYVNKGIGRPHFNEQERKTALESIRYIDFVIINYDLTSIKLINSLKPSIYFKGIDYKSYSNDKTGNIIKEEQSIKKVGGKIYFTETKKLSSTFLINNFIKFSKEKINIINKIKKQYSITSILNKIEKFSQKKVLIIGEIILDKYVYTSVLGKAGKDPILTFKKESTDTFLGGSLAIANHLSDFCKKVDVLSYIGDKDKNNNIFKDNLRNNINLINFQKKNSPTITKTRFIDKETNNKIIGIYEINDDLIEIDLEKKILQYLDKNIKKYDLVVVADYGHGLLTKKTRNLIVNKSKFLSVNAQLNSANYGFHTISKYSHSNTVCMHEGELRHDLRMKSEDINAVIKKLSTKIKSKNIFVTRGKNGAVKYSNNAFTYCPAFNIGFKDKVGAGDAFFAIISLCSEGKFSSELTILLGNIFGYLAVNTIGNSSPISKKELFSIIKGLISS